MKRRFLLALLLALPACAQREGSVPMRSRIPKRIISVVPSATEMLFALGVGDRVIAVGDYDRFPPEVESRPRIGGLLNPNIEKIIEMKPDLVLTYGSQEVLRAPSTAPRVLLRPGGGRAQGSAGAVSLLWRAGRCGLHEHPVAKHAF